MAKEFKLSAERLEEHKQELNYLKTVREKEVADQIKEARSFGDLSENSEYDEAKNEQGKLYSRIAEVENILANYVVIEEHETDPNSVRLGSKVKVLDLEFEVCSSDLQRPSSRYSSGCRFRHCLSCRCCQ